MASKAAILLQQNWPKFTAQGATKTCTYQQMGDSSYVGGNVTKPIISSTPNMEIIFDALGTGGSQKFQNTLDDGETIRSIDRVVIFPSLDLPVVPKINDLIVDPSLIEWKVKATADDPVDAHYELWVRPINVS